MVVGWFLESFVSATLQVGLGMLADLGKFAYYASIPDVDDKLKKLRRTLTSVQMMLDDEEIVRAWEDLAYDAGDLIDEIHIASSKLNGHQQGNSNLVNKLLSSVSKLTSAPKINDLQAQLNQVLDVIGKSQRKCYEANSSTNVLQTTSLVDEFHVFGREKDKNNVIKMLVDSEENYVTIIPIVSMIGVGKTTLAQLVFKEIPHSLDLKLWVYVGKDFDIMRLTRSIIEAAGGEDTSHFLNLNSIQLRLMEIFQGKKFLLVLDDLWNEKPEQLDLLLRPLRHGAKGGKIIITTRSRHAVPALEGTTEQYHLKCLSDQDCWLLLKNQVFGDIHVNIGPKMEAIGKKIAARCKGLPLTVKSLGGLLRRSVNEVAWTGILGMQTWPCHIEAVGTLRSSFCDHLPSHLKHCFAYCSIFPKRYIHEKEKLVRMWMGEGFVIPCIEDIGKAYFEELFEMTIFDRMSGKYVLNEAIQDLAQSICGEKFFKMEDSHDSCISTNTRHLSLVHQKIHTRTLEASYACKGLRTLLLFSQCGTVTKEVPFALFMNLGCLRVLDLSSTRIKDLAESIGNLRHLRFLDVSNTLIGLLPDTVQHLGLLQTLTVVNCPNLFYLPEGMSKLINLEHLDLGRDSRLTSMPHGIGKLAALQRLSVFIVGSRSGQIKELKDMNNICGALYIKQLQNVTNPEEACEVSLAKKNIEELELEWTSVTDACSDEHFLGKLMTNPHNTLKKLTLRRYAGRMLPSWVSDPCSKLTSILLKDCKNCRILPCFGKLSTLKSLTIEGMHELEKVHEDFCGKDAGFQSLETLKFAEMPMLKSWVGLCDGDMASLRELTIAECPQMITLPSLNYLRSLEKLELENCRQIPSLPEEALSSSIKYLSITGCPMLNERCELGGEDWMKIMHIPYTMIDE